MAVHQLRIPTPAETTLIALAEREIGTADRQAAIDTLRREGLPTRRVEAWHYTDLRTLMGRQSGRAETASPAETLLAPFLPNSTVVDLEAGERASLPKGVKVERAAGSADWQRSPNHLDRPFDTIRVLNAAFGAAATQVEVEAGTRLAAPIELRASPTGAGAQSYATCKVGDDASAVFVERLTEGAATTPSTGVSHLTIGERADVLWIVDQAKGDAETHLGQLNVTVGAGATFRLFVLNGGGKLVRYEVHAVTAGEGADIQIRGVNLLKDGQHVDVTTTLNHTVPHTTSTETFRNVVTGGHGVFQGMIRVARVAQKTDARMACNSLLLSDEGDFSAKPELEIFADDVQCGHGATAGEIDADHLFYLMSRGIPERAARALLVRAFVKEVVEELEHEAAIEALEARIDAWLALD